MIELKKRKIIAIVEDDSSFLRATENMLNAHGFETGCFASAQEFLDRGIATPFDCLLLDIHLGGMSGIELRRRLEAAASPVPVIFMTAVDSQMVRGEALTAGSVAYLLKPFAPHQLLDAIDRAAP
jgi:FixJ family two-component response regulator